MKILHIAHCPMQWVPLSYRDMERRHGDTSDLIFLTNPFDTRDFPVLPQPLFTWPWLMRMRRKTVEDRWEESKDKILGIQKNQADKYESHSIPLQIRPGNSAQKIWRACRDTYLRKKIPGLVKQYKLDEYEIVHYHGGRDYTWSADLAQYLHERGAKISCVYHGTDLRIEGVIPQLDKLSQLNLTSEHDLVDDHPNIHWLPLPFDIKPFNQKVQWNKVIRIVHAPSDRYNKGTDYILPVIEKLKKDFIFEFTLVEGKSQEETRKIKFDCELCIDQIGNRGGSGFGISSLECFAMGIPCISDFTPEVEALMPGHPFYIAAPENLESSLRQILVNPESLEKKGLESFLWIQQNNSFECVYQQKMELYRQCGWVQV